MYKKFPHTEIPEIAQGMEKFEQRHTISDGETSSTAVEQAQGNKPTIQFSDNETGDSSAQSQTLDSQTDNAKSKNEVDK